MRAQQLPVRELLRTMAVSPEAALLLREAAGECSDLGPLLDRRSSRLRQRRHSQRPRVLVGAPPA